MKMKIITIALMSLFSLTCLSQNKMADQKINLNNELDKVSYSLGVSIVNNLKNQGLDSINADAFAQGVKDAFFSTPLYDEKVATQILNDYFGTLQKKKHEGNIQKGEAFMKENATRKEVKTLASGIQYEVLKEGTGEMPKLTDKVKTHYHGTLIDGTVFDSSVQRGEPASFPVNGVIKGWQEVLQLMKVGSKWKVVIPYALAYGERGAGQQIAPYSTLVFEIELISIEK